jgi:hypothetical protein
MRIGTILPEPTGQPSSVCPQSRAPHRCHCLSPNCRQISNLRSIECHIRLFPRDIDPSSRDSLGRCRQTSPKIIQKRYLSNDCPSPIAVRLIGSSQRLSSRVRLPSER